MTKLFVSFLVVVPASSALAHSGAHLHPHATDASWLPLVVGVLALGVAAKLAWTFK